MKKQSIWIRFTDKKIFKFLPIIRFHLVKQDDIIIRVVSIDYSKNPLTVIDGNYLVTCLEVKVRILGLLINILLPYVVTFDEESKNESYYGA